MLGPEWLSLHESDAKDDSRLALEEESLASSPAPLSFADFSQHIAWDAIQNSGCIKLLWTCALGALSPDPSERAPVNVLPLQPETKQPWSNASDLAGPQHICSMRNFSVKCGSTS